MGGGGGGKRGNLHSKKTFREPGKRLPVTVSPDYAPSNISGRGSLVSPTRRQGVEEEEKERGEGNPGRGLLTWDVCIAKERGFHRPRS